MDDTEFDRLIVTHAFAQAAVRGWRLVSVADAARSAGLDLARTRARFPGRSAVLLRFGVMADQAALNGAIPDPDPRERLFDILMRRFDALQQHRDGVAALLRSLSADPATAALLYAATLRSLRWMLDGAGIPAGGVVGALRTHGLLAIWLYALRAWETDSSPDLSSTMAAVDRGLRRAVQAEGWLPAGCAPAAETAVELFQDTSMEADSATPPPAP